MNTGIYLTLFLIAAVFLCLPGFVHAQTGPTPGMVPAVVDESVASGNIKPVRDAIEELEKRIESKYAARLDALSIEKRTFEWTVWIFTALVTLFAIAAAAVAFRFGKSFRELRDSVREDATATFRAEFLHNADQLEDVARLKKRYEDANDALSKITSELQGYAALAQAAQNASGFDPLVEYFSLDREIDHRFDRTRKMLSGDDSISLTETTHDKEFRQRAATMFERLLAAVRRGREDGETPKMSANTLYNAAANASRAELDFVSLQLMQVASEMSHGTAPEIESRYIRQQLAMSAISADEARQRISAVLADTLAYDVHLSLAESFNLGMRLSDPPAMAILIGESLPEPLRRISYVKLIAARLNLMGGGTEEWERAKTAFAEGIRAFADESPTARWYKHSAEEIGSILDERPDFADVGDPPLLEVLGVFSNPRHLVKKFGVELASSLARAGLLEKLIVNPVKDPSAADDDV